jgi:hypothetical protein
MGGEDRKFRFVEKTLDLAEAAGRGHSGPGTAAPTLAACGWLDAATHGVDLGAPNGHVSVTLAPLRGAPPPGPVARPVCAWADGLVPGQRLFVEYRAADGWDRAIPANGGARGYLVAHASVPGAGQASVLLAAAAASPGADIYVERAGVRLSVLSEDAQGVTVVAARQNRPATSRTPAVVSWGPGRLDIFGLGKDAGLYHKAWSGHWYPSVTGWEALGGPVKGRFTQPAVASWGANRLDLFGIGEGYAMHHRAWKGQVWQGA